MRRYTERYNIILLTIYLKVGWDFRAHRGLEDNRDQLIGLLCVSQSALAARDPSYYLSSHFRS
jgi:hypothetical protein